MDGLDFRGQLHIGAGARRQRPLVPRAVPVGGDSFVGEPECNGVAERFMRTLKEQRIYLHQFRTLEDARRIIAEFIVRYDAEWLIERFGHWTPAQVGANAQRKAA
jgi:hypothetical protein